MKEGRKKDGGAGLDEGAEGGRTGGAKEEEKE